MKYSSLVILLIVLLDCKGTNKEFQKDKTEANTLIKKQITLVGDSLPKSKDAKYQYEVVEKYAIDLNNDGIEDHIHLEKIKDWNDPGDFQLITVAITNGEKFELFNIDGWIDTKLISEFIPNFNDSNLVNSQYLTIKTASDNKCLLFFKGYHYASHPGLLSIITVVNNKPVLIFNKEVNVFQFEDLNDDGVKDLVTIDCYKQFYNDNVLKKVFLFDGGFKQINRNN
ncbi:hypothetical protein [Marinifilum flexuosum]|uniref:hypothetical protein n=1 Tax=Marinifilum flexuosum TaxID=1117708 RepID=UPI00248F93FA|nr:hypothetical protein [Marinifilum flexuosum]